MALATTGITTSLVGTTLGTSSRNVSALCTNGNINKWSKKKPVELNTATPNRSGDWYIGDNGCCGFDIDSIYFNTIDALITAYKNGTTYRYKVPTGYKRLADFGGYEHKAQSPNWGVNIEGMIYADTPSSFFNVIVDWNSNVNTSTNITLSELVPNNLVSVKDCYFGIIMVVGNNRYVKTNPNKIGANGLNYNYGNNNVTVYQTDISAIGTYSVYPAIFTLPYTSFTSNMQGTKFIAIPPAHSGTFQTVTSIKASPFTGQIAWMYAYYSQGAKLTVGGTLSYNKSYEGNNVIITVGKTVNGVDSTLKTTTEKLTKGGSNGDNYNTMDFEYSLTQATSSNTIYWMKATLSNYTTTIQCEEPSPL